MHNLEIPRKSAKHTFTFILDTCDNWRAKNFEIGMKTELPPDNAKNLEMLFSEIYILKILDPL